VRSILDGGGRRRSPAPLIPLLLLAAAAALPAPVPHAAAAASLRPAPAFTDVAAAVGLDFVHDPAVEGEYWMPESIGSGGALFDYDGDGDLDVYLVDGSHRSAGEGNRGGGVLRNRLFRRDSSGRFVDVTERSGLGDPGYGMGVAVGDVDGDGDLDVYVTNVGADRLYRNRGDGTFAEVTGAAGIDNPAWGTSAAFVDYDLDGDLDLYVADYVDFDPAVVCTDAAGRRDYCGPAGFPGVADRLYRNRGDGTFEDVSAASGIGAVARKGLGVVAADLDGDGLPDLYVADDGEPNLLWVNRGDGTFEDRAVPEGAAVNAMGRPEAGMGIALGDADGDGLPDLFITHLRSETNTLYRGAGPLGFADATDGAGLAGPSLPWTGFGTAFVDVDLDGDLDLVVVNGRVTRGPLETAARPPAYWDAYAEPDLLFLNDGAGRFVLAGAEGGLADLPPANGRGLATGDVDGDGAADLLVTDEGGPVRLLRGEPPAGRHWLEVRLAEPGRGRDGGGAPVAVAAGGRRLRRWIVGGGSFLSASDPTLHFGLGKAAAVEEVAVSWPGGGRLVLRGLPADRLIVVRRPPETAGP
jgi:enediyne biosynthesis protein E4